MAPVNFFIPKLDKYPLFEQATRSQVNLGEGDCIFIPAYYYYQVQGMHNIMGQFPTLFKMFHANTTAEAKKEKYGKDIATAVSLKFEGNSQLLAGFYDAIEKKIIK